MSTTPVDLKDIARQALLASQLTPSSIVSSRLRKKFSMEMIESPEFLSRISSPDLIALTPPDSDLPTDLNQCGSQSGMKMTEYLSGNTHKNYSRSPLKNILNNHCSPLLTPLKYKLSQDLEFVSSPSSETFIDTIDEHKLLDVPEIKTKLRNVNSNQIDSLSDVDEKSLPKIFGLTETSEPPELLFEIEADVLEKVDGLLEKVGSSLGRADISLDKAGILPDIVSASIMQTSYENDSEPVSEHLEPVSVEMVSVEPNGGEQVGVEPGSGASSIVNLTNEKCNDPLMLNVSGCYESKESTQQMLKLKSSGLKNPFHRSLNQSVNRQNVGLVSASTPIDNTTATTISPKSSSRKGQSGIDGKTVVRNNTLHLQSKLLKTGNSERPVADGKTVVRNIVPPRSKLSLLKSGKSESQLGKGITSSSKGNTNHKEKLEDEHKTEPINGDELSQIAETCLSTAYGVMRPSAKCMGDTTKTEETARDQVNLVPVEVANSVSMCSESSFKDSLLWMAGLGVDKGGLVNSDPSAVDEACAVHDSKNTITDVAVSERKPNTSGLAVQQTTRRSQISKSTSQISRGIPVRKLPVFKQGQGQAKGQLQKGLCGSDTKSSLNSTFDLSSEKSTLPKAPSYQRASASNLGLRKPPESSRQIKPPSLKTSIPADKRVPAQSDVPAGVSSSSNKLSSQVVDHKISKMLAPRGSLAGKTQQRLQPVPTSVVKTSTVIQGRGADAGSMSAKRHSLTSSATFRLHGSGSSVASGAVPKEKRHSTSGNTCKIDKSALARTVTREVRPTNSGTVTRNSQAAGSRTVTKMAPQAGASAAPPMVEPSDPRTVTKEAQPVGSRTITKRLSSTGTKTANRASNEWNFKLPEQPVPTPVKPDKFIAPKRLSHMFPKSVPRQRPRASLKLDSNLSVKPLEESPSSELPCALVVNTPDVEPRRLSMWSPIPRNRVQAEDQAFACTKWTKSGPK